MQIVLFAFFFENDERLKFKAQKYPITGVFASSTRLIF
jgi:hypothetical protein